jgi:hypothetical protein
MIKSFFITVLAAIFVFVVGGLAVFDYGIFMNIYPTASFWDWLLGLLANL